MLLCTQVGNWTTDQAHWERPEDDKSKRPVYYVTTKNGARTTNQGFSLDIRSPLS